MKKIRRILVPTDFSRPSDRALGYALSLCRALGAELHAVHFVEVDGSYFRGGIPATSPSSLERLLLAAAEKDLARQVAAAGLREPHKSRLVLAYGSVSAAIRAEAKKMKADLVVIPTHGRGGFERYLLGSVAERVVRTAPVPVWVLRANRALPKARPRTIVAPVDFSAVSVKAAKYAVVLARILGAKVELVHATDPMCLERYGEKAYTESMAVAARRLMDRLVRRLDAKVVRAGTVLSGSGEPSARIVREAARARADLIVMATNGRRGWDRFTLGSETERILRGSPTAVLTLK